MLGSHARVTSAPSALPETQKSNPRGRHLRQTVFISVTSRIRLMTTAKLRRPSAVSVSGCSHPIMHGCLSKAGEFAGVGEFPKLPRLVQGILPRLAEEANIPDCAHLSQLPRPCKGAVWLSEQKVIHSEPRRNTAVSLRGSISGSCAQSDVRSRSGCSPDGTARPRSDSPCVESP